MQMTWKNLAIFVGCALTVSALAKRRRSYTLKKPEATSLGGALHGAKSAVTGGSPEDINGMPPNLDPQSGEPTIDGSDLWRAL